MKRTILLSCWIGIAAYCGLASLIGPSGLAATAKAQASADDMRRNLDELAALNASYTEEWNALRNSSAATALEARSLGYLASDETVIRLGLAGERAEPARPGTRLSYEAGAALSDSGMKELAALAALLVAAASLAWRLVRGRRAAQRDIRVQEASRT